MKLGIDITLPLDASMLEQENAIRSAINHDGLFSTRLLLENVDTKGQQLVMNDAQRLQIRLSSKDCNATKQIETPYNCVMFTESAGAERASCGLTKALACLAQPRRSSPRWWLVKWRRFPGTAQRTT